MQRVCLITKLVTTNVGNQALSNELIRLLHANYGQNLVAVMGRPTGLEGYSLERLKGSRGRPVNVFNAWADGVVNDYRQTKHDFHPLHRPDERSQVRLIQPSSTLTFVEAVKRPLRSLRGSFRRFGVCGSAYLSRLRTLAHCDRIIYNGAGEIRDSDVALRQLLEVRIAQKVGCDVVPINQGLVIRDSVLLEILIEAYTHCSTIVVRGRHSQELLTDGGVSEAKVHIAPDAAYLARPAGQSAVQTVIQREAVTAGTVGIALTDYHIRDLSGWDKIVQALLARGKKVIFVSNDLYQDGVVGKAFQNRYGINVMSRQYDYEEYIGLLSMLELVISGRLHTNIFAMVGHVPIIPLENCDGKIGEVFRFIDPSIEMVDVSRENWAEKCVDTIANIYNNHAAVKQGTVDKLVGIREALATSGPYGAHEIRSTLTESSATHPSVLRSSSHSPGQLVVNIQETRASSQRS